ncbi:MAG: hypothetical protein L0Y68_05615 [Candidatus Dadabacteria bacterium]|nr:hypothetical protein [Candidatus Dadabacteria bacterium]
MMKKFPKNISLFLALTLVISITLLSCGGGGGGGGGQAGGTSTINGNVADVVAMAPRKEEPSMLTLFKDFFSFSKTANAQGSGVSGITVIALQGGVTVDTSTTDSDGNFILTVSPGNVTLVFPDFDASIVIFVPASIVLIIVVVLQPDEVIVEEMEIDGTINCETGFIEIVKEDDVDLVIDGEGGDCIRVGGNCTLNIDPENIILTDCERCIRAEGGAEVTLATTDGDIICDASGDGISTVGNATVILDASGSGDIDISAGGNGISAVGTSEVNLFATGVIDIFGGQNGVEAKGTPLVDLDGGSCIIDGDVGSDFEVEGNAMVNACGITIP